MKPFNPFPVEATLGGLLITLFASLAIAQTDQVLSPDAIKPEAALSPEQTNPPPVRSSDYTKPDEALSPEQTDPPPVRSLGYTKPDEALSPEQTDPPPVLAPN